MGKTRELESTEALITQLEAGDARAGEVLFGRYYPRIERAVAIKTYGLPIDAETRRDLVQDTMMSAIRGLPGFDYRETSAFKRWIWVICSNAVAAYARRESNRPDNQRHVLCDEASDVHLDHRVPNEQKTPSEELARREAWNAVARELAKLPQGDRDLVTLRSVLGLSYEECARTLDIPTASAARKKYSRALAAIAKTAG